MCLCCCFSCSLLYRSSAWSEKGRRACLPTEPTPTRSRSPHRQFLPVNNRVCGFATGGISPMWLPCLAYLCCLVRSAPDCRTGGRWAQPEKGGPWFGWLGFGSWLTQVLFCFFFMLPW
ncbi:hypothetical protein QBC37DRAFT_155303 [Rhypophila decipiens]|uniref:Secreted protein n=1 Tax=Rhypophila decipiens TaxID=261697 RepID=A0AAN7BAZ1_9PEZI|nr:hypothetical protein QBC37DRAFT_155303 [Rhypophila decipiens]